MTVLFPARTAELEDPGFLAEVGGLILDATLGPIKPGGIPSALAFGLPVVFEPQGPAGTKPTTVDTRTVIYGSDLTQSLRAASGFGGLPLDTPQDISGLRFTNEVILIGSFSANGVVFDKKPIVLDPVVVDLRNVWFDQDSASTYFMQIMSATRGGTVSIRRFRADKFKGDEIDIDGSFASTVNLIDGYVRPLPIQVGLTQTILPSGIGSALAFGSPVVSVTPAGAVSTPSAHGPTSTINPATSTGIPSYTVQVTAAGTLKRGDTGAAVTISNTEFTGGGTLVIESDAPGTRRTPAVGVLDKIRVKTGKLIIREIHGTTTMGQMESVGSTADYAIQLEGCDGTFAHWRAVNSLHYAWRLTKSAANLWCGATSPSSTWSAIDYSNPDVPTPTPTLRIDNCTGHGSASTDGSAMLIDAALNTFIGGFDCGSQSTPLGTMTCGVKWEATIRAGGVKNDVQDVYVGKALDGTTSKLSSLTATPTLWAGFCRRSGIWEGTFLNASGQRPDFPIWFALANGTLPSGMTALNTKNDQVVADGFIMREAIAQNLVTATFRDGLTGSLEFDVKPEVYDPATPLTLWTPADVTDIWPNGAKRFIFPRPSNGGALGPVATNAASMPAGGGNYQNATKIDETWTHMGGKAPDGVTEVRDVKFDISTMVDGVNTLLSPSTGKDGGIQLVLQSSVTIDASTNVKTLTVRKADGSMPSSTEWAKWSDASTTITSASGSAPSMPIVVPSIAWLNNEWVAVLKTDGSYYESKVTRGSGGTNAITNYTLQAAQGTAASHTGARIVRMTDQYGLFTSYVDANWPLGSVALGFGVRRQLSFTTLDKTTGQFKGCKLIPGPVGTGPVLPSGRIIKIVAGVVHCWYPHGMPTSDTTDISCPTVGAQAAVSLTNAPITRLDKWTFLLNGQTSVNWNAPGNYGTFTPKTPHAYGLLGQETSITLTTGTTLDDTKNANLGQPTHNAKVVVKAGSHVRFVRVNFSGVGLQAEDSTCWIEMVDCIQPVPGVPGNYDYSDCGELGVCGKYDPANQYATVIGGNNIIVVGGARHFMERTVNWGTHGDYNQGDFTPESYRRHCWIEHGRDINGTAAGNSNQRPANVGLAIYPKVAPGPHGDDQQWYNNWAQRAYGCVEMTSAHSVYFGRFENNYQVFDTGVTIVNDGTGHLKLLLSGTTWPKGSSLKTGSHCLIRNSSRSSYNGYYLVTDITSKTDTDQIFTIGAQFNPLTMRSVGPAPTYVGDATATFVQDIHIHFEIRRGVILIGKMSDTTDVTRSGPVEGDGNVSISQTITDIVPGVTNVIAGELEISMIFHDTIIGALQGAAGSWFMETPVSPSDFDIIRAVWGNPGMGGAALPGGAAAPALT